MERRGFLLAVVSATTGAGCLGGGEGLSHASPTKTVDCTIYPLTIWNRMEREAAVRIWSLSGWGRYRGRNSPTETKARSPTDTLEVLFSDRVTIPPDGKKKYGGFPISDSRQRVKVSVENGPSDTKHLRKGELGGRRTMSALIQETDITFTSGELARREECSPTPHNP